MPSFRGKILMRILSAVFHSRLNDSTKLSDNAGKASKKIKSRYKPSSGFELTVHKCGDIKYEKLICKKCKTDKVLLHIHGGGFRVPLIDFYRRLAEKYSRLFDGATVINVDYGTFPQHKLPSQMFDVVNVYIDLLKQGINNKNIVVIGDSAGANLAITSSLWLRDKGYPPPSHIVCFSLWGDATSSGESRIKNAYTDPFYGLSKKEKIEDNLHILRRISSCVEDVDRTDPYISPCFANFEKFPQTTLICGTAELDESDNDRVYEKMKKAEVDVKLYKFEGLCHDFQLFSFLPESKQAFDIIKRRVTNES